MALNGTINYFDGTRTAVTIGVGEQVKAPRDLAALEKQGWVVDDSMKVTYQAFLAAKRQGDLDVSVKFEDWVDGVTDVDLRPSRKQIEQAVALGSMDADQAEKLLAVLEDDEGEA